EPNPDTVAIAAQFNPKELQIDTQLSYQPHAKGGPADIEFLQREPRTFTLELLFDGFENKVDVTACVAALHKLTDKVPKLRRPPKCSILWGETARAIPRFDCIIEKVSVKYQMFAPDGGVLRATCTVSFKEAAHAYVGKPKR